MQEWSTVKKADWTFLYINHGCEFVKSDLIWGGDLIWDGNYADILGGEVKKTLYMEFSISIFALRMLIALQNLYVLTSEARRSILFMKVSIMIKLDSFVLRYFCIGALVTSVDILYYYSIL